MSFRAVSSTGQRIVIAHQVTDIIDIKGNYVSIVKS